MYREFLAFEMYLSSLSKQIRDAKIYIFNRTFYKIYFLLAFWPYQNNYLRVNGKLLSLFQFINSPDKSEKGTVSERVPNIY